MSRGRSDDVLFMMLLVGKVLRHEVSFASITETASAVNVNELAVAVDQLRRRLVEQRIVIGRVRIRFADQLRGQLLKGVDALWRRLIEIAVEQYAVASLAASRCVFDARVIIIR